MNGGRADRLIRRTTIGCVGMLALIAGTVSYLHMHLLVELHGQPGWVAALTPLSVDGMIVAASTTLLADSQPARPCGFFVSCVSFEQGYTASEEEPCQQPRLMPGSCSRPRT